MAYFTQRRPQYTIDLDQSTFSFHSIDRRKDEYTFTVEQGCRFYLQLNLTASPFPTRADLYKDGQLVESTRNGTIFVGIDRIGIQSVDRLAYAGSYRLVSSNDAGHGEITFHLKVQEPVFKINWTESVYSNYDSSNDTITVEQGTPFYLKFEISAYPIPTHVELYKDGKKVQTSRTNGTIFVGLDRVSIPTVDRKSYAGKYTISAANQHGEGHAEFKLKVKATHGYNQPKDRLDSTDPSRWC